MSYKKYLTINPNIDFDIDKEIIFPDNIDELFYAYFRLNDEQKLIINNISSHISNSIELFHSKRTLSLLAAFTALETLINFEYMGVKIKNCCKCGLPEFKISEKFKDFLQKYVGTSAFNKKKFNSFYQLRSKIIHTGQQLKTEFLFNELSNEDRHSELVTRIEIIQMAKIAIMNWLLKRFK